MARDVHAVSSMTFQRLSSSPLPVRTFAAPPRNPTNHTHQLINNATPYVALRSTLSSFWGVWLFWDSFPSSPCVSRLSPGARSVSPSLSTLYSCSEGSSTHNNKTLTDTPFDNNFFTMTLILATILKLMYLQSKQYSFTVKLNTCALFYLFTSSSTLLSLVPFSCWCKLYMSSVPIYY